MGTSQTPRVLLVTAFRWITSVRAALEFCQSGYEVHVVCPSWSDFAAQPFVSRFWRLGLFRPENNVLRAIVASHPDLIIPLDDCARRHLNSIYTSSRTSDLTRSLIVRSLGDPTHYATLYDRAGLSSLAHKLGLVVPTTLSVDTTAELAMTGQLIGFPAVLKTDGSWGGQGVEIVNNNRELTQSFNRLKASKLLRAFWRVVRKSDFSLLWPSLSGHRPKLSLQRFIQGRPANASVVCWQGEVLGRVDVEVLQSRGPTGPATVVRLIDHPDIAETISTVVRQLGMSGFCGFDFILTTDNRAVFLELNPRATPTFHLVGARNTVLIELLKERSTGAVPGPLKSAAQTESITLFPQELMRDSQSLFLSAGFQDVPHNAPDFIALAHKLATRRAKAQNWDGAREKPSQVPAKNPGV